MNKKITAAISVLLMSFVLAGGVFASEKSFSSISELTLKGVSDFRIEKADKASVSISGNENAVTMLNEAGYLYIEASAPVQVVIRTPELDSLVLADRSAGTMAGSFEADSLSLSLTGSSRLDINDTVKAEAIKVHAGNNSVLEGKVDAMMLFFNSTSASDVTLSGEVRNLRAELSMGHVHFQDMNVQNAAIIASGRAVVEAEFPGNSDVQTTVDGYGSVSLDMNGLLSARATGDGAISYSGNIEWVGRYNGEDASISRM